MFAQFVLCFRRILLDIAPSSERVLLLIQYKPTITKRFLWSFTQAVQHTYAHTVVDHGRVCWQGATYPPLPIISPYQTLQ